MRMCTRELSLAAIAGSLRLWSAQHLVGAANARHPEASARWRARDDGRHESSPRYEPLETGNMIVAVL